MLDKECDFCKSVFNGGGTSLPPPPCLFFSENVYFMSVGKSWVYEADFNCIEACFLEDEETVKRIMEVLECDEDDAWDFLQNRKSVFEMSGNENFDASDLAEKDWWLQGLRGQVAKKMGYDGCEDTDEQGTVYIVPMYGRESELRLVEIVK